MTAARGETERRASERAIALLMLLLQSRSGYTAARIREIVEGYAGLSDAAFDKAFRRDRELLEDIGVPLTLHEQDEAEPRHRVEASALLLPEIDFTAAERRALLHAREVGTETRLQSEVTRAVGLLVDPGSAAAAPEDRFGLPRILRRITPGLAVFLDAAVEQRTLAFGYRAASGEATAQGRPRRVRIWACLEIGGAWYAAGWDLDRQAERLFRISRVIGDPVEVPGSAAQAAPTRPADWDPTSIRDRLLGQDEARAEKVRLWVAPGRGQTVRLAGTAVAPTAADGPAPGPRWELWEIDRPAHDGLVRLCGGLLGVVHPSAARPEVQAELRQAWQRLLDLHRDPAPAPPPLGPVHRRRYRQGRRERVSRLLDIVGLANRAGGISKDELAHRLELSRKELDADLRDLQYCGLPEREFPGWLFDVDAQAEIVRIHQAPDLPAPIRLSVPEAYRLCAALDTVAQMPHAADDVAPAARTAAARLRTVLADSGHHGAAAAPATARHPGERPDRTGGEPAELDPVQAPPVASFWDVQASPEVVRVLMDAVASHEVVRLRYHSLHTDVSSEREVEPLQLVQSGTVLYLQAHCRTAGALRTFRVERISSLDPLGQAFPPRARPSTPVLTPQRPQVDVVMAWAHRIRDLADDYAPVQEAEDASGRRITRIGFLSADTAVALAARHAGEVEVLAPVEVRHTIAERAVAALRRR